MMKKNSPFLIILFSILISVKSFAGTFALTDSFRYEATIKNGQTPVSGMVINVYLDNKKISSKLSNRQGNFFFYFLHNKQYTLELIKKDYILEKVVIDSKVSDALLKNRGIEMAIDNEIPVFEYYEGVKAEIFDTPVIFYVYNENNGFFEQDRKRTKSQINSIASKITSLRNKSANDALKKANDFFKKQKYEEALIEFSKVVEINPNNDQALAKIDEIKKILKGNQSEIENSYKQYINSADKSFNEKKYNEAIDFYKKASVLKPDKPYPQNQIFYIDSLLSQLYNVNKPEYDRLKLAGDLNFKNKKYDQALNNYENALSLMPGEPVISKLIKNTKAIIDAENKKIEEEKKALAEKVKATLKKASDYFDKKDYANAIAMYNQALQLDSGNNNSNNNILALKTKASNLLTEQAALKLKLQKEKSYNDTLKLADSCFKVKSYDLAISFYKKTLNIFPEEKYPAKKIKEVEKKLAELNKVSVNVTDTSKIVSNKSTNKTNEITASAKKYQEENNYKKALSSLEEAYTQSIKSNDKKVQVEVLNQFASVYYDSGLYKLSINSFEKALVIKKEMKDKAGSASIYSEIGTALSNLYSYDKALEAFFSAAELYNSLGNKTEKAKTLGKIASTYYNQNNYTKSLEYSKKAISDAKITGDEQLVSNLTNNLGVLYYKMGKFDDAVSCYNEVIDLDKKNGNTRNLSLVYNNLGNINFDWNQYETAISFYEKSINIKRKLNFEEGVAVSLLNIANAYIELKKPEQAIEFLNSALKVAEDVKFADVVKQAYLALGKAYELKQDTKMALSAYKQLAAKGSSSVTGQMVETENMYFSDSKTIRQLKKELVHQKILTENEALLNKQKTQQLIMKELQLSKQKAKNARNTVLLLFFLVVAITAGVIALQYFKRNREKKLYIEIIEFQNHQIKDSIEYAGRIQKAVLPPVEFVKTVFPQSFLINKPKDIVSGDFYFITTINNKIYVAVADCTGHGVPGAFMSMLGYSLSKEVVQMGPTEVGAAKVLDLLRDSLMKSLHQTGKDDEAKDGMDIALCIIDQEKMKLEFSGANNPCYIIRNNEFIELKPDRMPIGIHPILNPFKSETVNLKKGDSLYLFSDGYRDQISGDTLKKFKKEQFKNFLISINGLDMDEQAMALEKCHTEWKGNMEQTDDIMVLGVRI